MTGLRRRLAPPFRLEQPDVDLDLEPGFAHRLEVAGLQPGRHLGRLEPTLAQHPGRQAGIGGVRAGGFIACLFEQKLANGPALHTRAFDLERSRHQHVVAVAEADIEARLDREAGGVNEVGVAFAAGYEDDRFHEVALLCRSIAVANREASAAGASESTSSVTWAASRLGSCLRSRSRCCS